MDHLSPLEMPGQVANHSGLFVASPLACPSDNSHANRQQSARSVQKKSSYPEQTVRSARVLEADGRLFDRGFLQQHHVRRRAERDEAVLAGHPRNQARLRGPGWKRFVQVKATPTAQMTGCRISSRVGPLASGCRRASGGRGTTRPFGLMLLTFPNGRG